MNLLDLTLPTPEANLAVDEALLNEAEAGTCGANVLRLWESPRPFVVIGRASRRDQEVDLAACDEAHVPVLRRCSGGTAVVAGPGCLMYAVILKHADNPELSGVDAAHQFVMSRMQKALQTVSANVEFRGTCDLCIGDRKISGNSLRLKRQHLLYHGTVLYDFDLESIERLLATPPRQPAYRNQRTHRTFVTNLPVSANSLREAICREWKVSDALQTWPESTTSQLVEDRYSKDEWHNRL